MEYPVEENIGPQALLSSLLPTQQERNKLKLSGTVTMKFWPTKDHPQENNAAKESETETSILQS